VVVFVKVLHPVKCPCWYVSEIVSTCLSSVRRPMYSDRVTH
jgi:hypothetical protein